MSRPKAIKSLLDQSIETLAANDTIEHDFDSIANFQHGQVAFDIIITKKLLTYKNLRWHQIRDLISKQLDRIESFYVKHSDEKLGKQILETVAAKKCPLKIFDISTKWQIDIKALLPALTNVEQINTSASPINEDDIKALKSCHNLQHLTITKPLRRDTLDFILREFKSLKSLSMSDDVAKAICRLRKSDPNFSTNLNVILVKLSHDVQLDPIVSAMPELNSLSLYTEHPDISPDLSCLHTNKVCLEILIAGKATGFMDYVLHLSKAMEYQGASLVSVDLNLTNVDLAHLIHYCPHLVELRLDSCSYVDNCIKRKLSPHPNLSELDFCSYNGNRYQTIDEECWIALLTKNLKDFSLHGFNGTHLQRALKTVVEMHDFPSLRRFSLEYVDVITLEDLLPVIDHLIIENVCILECDDINQDDLARYKQRRVTSHTSS